MKWNLGDIFVNSCQTGCIYKKGWKWPPPSARHIWNRRCLLLAVCCGIDIGDLQPDVLFQNVCVSKFVPVHSLLQVAPKKKKIEDIKSGDQGGHTFFQMIIHLKELLITSIENKRHSKPSAETAANYSCPVPAWTGNASKASSVCFRPFI